MRNTGWTYAQCEETSASDVWDLLKDLADSPPDYEILAAVHLKPKPKPPTEAEIQGKMHELGAMMGTGMGQAPPGFAEAVAWADEKQRLLTGKKSHG